MDLYQLQTLPVLSAGRRCLWLFSGRVSKAKRRANPEKMSIPKLEGQRLLGSDDSKNIF